MIITSTPCCFCEYRAQEGSKAQPSNIAIHTCAFLYVRYHNCSHFSRRYIHTQSLEGSNTLVPIIMFIKTFILVPNFGLQPIDHKNIRRRVYDALNVLMAMNIISKEKKEIRWLGLPTNSAQECQHIEVGSYV